MTIWRAGSLVPILLACLLLSGQSAAGQESKAGYRIKPSDVAVPPDVKLGGYQRTIRPFGNWTLICDENLEAKQRVCNATQVIEDATGKMAFSWSLAATRDGKPYMILRTAPDARQDGLISFSFEGRGKLVEVRLDGCNEMVCVGMLPVGPIMREQISKSAAPEVSYETTGGNTVTVIAPLEGLSNAVAAIN